MSNEADYAYWYAALDGKFGPVHDGDAQCGFYRTKRGEPVAIFRDNLGLIVAQKGDTVVNADDIWTWVCERPVTHEAYEAKLAGNPWPDEAVATVGHNNPPADEIEADEIDSAIQAALAAIATPPKSQTEADRLGNHRDRLAKLYKQEDTKRETEKKPHLEAGREIDARFKPILAKIEDAGKKVKAALTAWLRAEQARIDRETRERIAAEEVARKAAIEANRPPPEPTPLPEPEKPRAGSMGRATGLRTFKSAIITDYKAALTHLREHPEIKEAVQRIANAAARTGVPIPGTEIHEEQRAA